MSTLLDLYIKESTLQTLLDTVRKKGEKGIALTVSVSDESNEYGQNVSAYVSQSKEQREEKKPRFYAGNGKVFWTDGKVVKADGKTNDQQAPQVEADSGDDSNLLPF